jgi:multidrug efflux pump subunit AcrA (membrane-fusion protein)
MRRARRRPPILTVALGVLTLAAVAVAMAVVGTPSTSSARERTVTVRRGVVESTVSGSGNLAAAKQVNLDFASSGNVTHIYVHEGEKVVKGQLLATIDPSSAKVAVAQAQADLQAAQDTLSSVSSSSSTTTTASTGTTAAVAYVAQANTPTTTTPTTTTPSTKKQSAPSSSSKRSTTQPAASSSSANSSSGSGTKTSYAAALAAVESAQLTVKSAQAELRGTKIIAPVAATVAEVNGSVGATAGSSSTGSSSFIVLAQLQRFKMDLSLTESDIGKVRVGQAATVTVNAASGAEFSAHVASVGVLPTSSSSSTSSSSAVSYPVTLVLDQGGAGIKPGMSASADIITSRASGIVVPTEALNGSTVTVVRNGKQVSRQVQTGVAGDTTTQVLAGLRAGDQVVINAATVTAAAGGTGNTGTGSRLGRFGGGELGGGGFVVPGGGGGPPGGFPK